MFPLSLVAKHNSKASTLNSYNVVLKRHDRNLYKIQHFIACY
ncbi:hypothetical protein NC652_005830 [Populus alba x Populus x berolinensis]|nr:hypothetical protein NC652_005830 [Populus alba x Populus x berolinensis]